MTDAILVVLLLLAVPAPSAQNGLQARLGLVREAGGRVQATARGPEVSAEQLSASVAVFAQAVERAEDNERYGRPAAWTNQESSVLAKYRQALDDYELSLLYLRSAEDHLKNATDASSLASDLARSERETAAQYWSKADLHLAAADRAFSNAAQPEGANKKKPPPRSISSSTPGFVTRAGQGPRARRIDRSVLSRAHDGAH